MKENWLIYGATGYTGELVAEEALKRGHRPVLAARSAQKLNPIATRLGLDSIVLNLDNPNLLAQVLRDFQVVYHAAGPFVHTSQPMLAACFDAQTHYLDISGEISVLERNLGLDREARVAGIVVVSGSGFDVIPTDCLASYVTGRISKGSLLEIGFSGISQSSAGTAKSGLEQSRPWEFYIRKDGKLVPIPMGFGGKRIRFLERERYAIPVSWGDLSTAYRSTGVRNIITYMAVEPQIATFLRRFGPSIQGLFRVPGVRNFLKYWIERLVKGPDEEGRQNSHTYVWARAQNSQGESAEAWLDTLEAYQFTAVAGVRCVEKLLNGAKQAGAFTPAQAFGTDFILEFPRTSRFDRLTD